MGLFQVSYDHVGGNDCADCCKDMLVSRAIRDETTGIFFGTIASGNQIKDGFTRDTISSKLGGLQLDTVPCYLGHMRLR
ncbi:hypothetical protein BDV11DRAFT_199673 [Aspergillus similis]